MNILMLSQVFWPDTVSTSQHLSDLADCLSGAHKVTVITGRHNYENNREKYAGYEERNGIRIIRINSTSFGKKNHFFRTLDILSFNLLLALRLCRISRKEVQIILGMTSPPLVSFVGVWFARRKKIPFRYWIMDLQPELSIASGLVRKGSTAASLFQWMGNYILKNSDRIIVLDKYMKAYVVKRGAEPQKIDIVPVWPVMTEIYEGPRLSNPFRIANGFGDRIVVMYSGNHSYVHPLNTLLEAALRLKDDGRFLFVFVGGGVRKKEVAAFKEFNRLGSILQLDYVSRDQIHLSLGSADLQVVIMGEKQVGFTHPNKVYGSMFIGKPILYVGPRTSHVTDILPGDSANILVEHGAVADLVAGLKHFADRPPSERQAAGERNKTIAQRCFHPALLKSRMCEAVTA